MALDILVVDDHPQFVKSWKTKFKDSVNFDIATNGEEAVRNVEDKPYSLVVLDYNLSTEIDGFQVAQKIRKIRPNTKMVGCSSSWRGQEAELAGLDDYFIIPDGVERYIAAMICERREE